ncbi:Hypothetical protein R9X50_00448500 [Acrodontium crateriforme]|uniref:Palmitoyltransferase n=1 Tax=Acrodontium crateriforme TaxID=150365 RepID=A0AAQ3RAU6_9PEZI|nr:Hypothetical protein R9X50_00448500 [Acrodontium crateriforme]
MADPTEIMSDGGDDFASARERQSDVYTMTGIVGDSGLPPSRPATNVSSPRGALLRQSNRKAGGVSGTRAGNSNSGSTAGSPSTHSRPTSPSSPMSKTHIPSIAAQGFSRPMSSLMLQAERIRPLTSTPTAKRTRDDDEVRRHRYSNASLSTLREANRTHDDEIPPLPPSRGTMTSTRHDGGAYAEAYTAGSLISNGSAHGSAAPLRTHQGQSSLPIDLKPEKRNSSKSLRASLGLSSQRLGQLGLDQRPSPRQHEILPSDPSSSNDDEKHSIGGRAARSKPKNGKNYEYFAGNMLFFVQGRCLNTKARPLNLVTLGLTALPGALFFVFSAPWLWQNVSPALPIVFAYVFFISISSFFHAAFSDPGILPRNMHPHPPNPEEENDPLAVGPPTTAWVMVKTFPSQKRSKSRDGNSLEAQRGDETAMEVPTKYCKSCNIWRPPRAHHCRVCDACIETQDHHCVWLNNCVGRRNYRFFFSYVGSATLMAILLAVFSLTHVILYAQNHNIGFGESLTGRTQERVAFAMFLYTIVAAPYPGSLFFYHIFLTSRGETTREYLNSHKFLPKDRYRPFSQSSAFQNLLSTVTRPRTPTYLQFKEKYTPGDARLGHVQPKKQRKRELKERYSTQQNGGKHGTELSQLQPPTKLQAKDAGGLDHFNSTPRL